MPLGRLQMGLLHSPAHLASPEKPPRAWPEGSHAKAPVADLLCSALIPEMNRLLLAGCSEGSPIREFLPQNPFHGPGTLQQ